MTSPNPPSRPAAASAVLTAPIAAPIAAPVAARTVQGEPEDQATPRESRSVLPLGVRQALPGLVALLVVLRLVVPVGDPDTFWHIAAGDHLRQTWSFAGADPWSTMSTQPWLLHEWLPELQMSWLHQFFGLAGVAFLLPLGGAMIVLALWRACRARASLLLSAVVMVVAVIGMSSSLSLRPHLVTFALAVVTVSAWLRTVEDGRARWWLIPLTWLWACCHGMWFVGVVIGVVVLVGMALDRRTGRAQWLRLALVPVASLAAAALTPTGPGLLLSPFAVQEMTQYVTEWAPPSLKQGGYIAFLVLAAAVVVVWVRSRRPVPWTSVLLVAASVGFALLYTRTVAVGSAIIAPVVAMELQRVIGTPAEPVQRREVALTVALTSVALVLAALLLPSRAAQPTWGANDLDRSLAALPDGTVLCNDYGSGGWLIWKHPNVRPAIDGRTEVYPVAHVDAYMDFQHANPGWQRYLTQTGCGWALVSSNLPAAEALVAQAHWTVTARGSSYVLLKAP